jgi:hypothetical protein
MRLEDRPILEQNAAGIEIGSREIFVAVPPDRDPNPVRIFPTFTEKSTGACRLAFAVWCDHRGHGKHGGTLPFEFGFGTEKPSPLRLPMDIGRAPIRILFRQAPD